MNRHTTSRNGCGQHWQSFGMRRVGLTFVGRFRTLPPSPVSSQEGFHSSNELVPAGLRPLTDIMVA